MVYKHTSLLYTVIMVNMNDSKKQGGSKMKFKRSELMEKYRAWILTNN